MLILLEAWTFKSRQLRTCQKDKRVFKVSLAAFVFPEFSCRPGSENALLQVNFDPLKETNSHFRGLRV